MTEAELTTLFDAAVAAAALMCNRSQILRSKRKREDVPNTMLPPPPLQPATLTQLIALAETSKTGMYRDCQKLPKLLPVLQELEQMVGLASIKQHVVEFVITRLQPELATQSLSHICLTGPPGAGKTTVANIVARIMSIICNTDQPRVVHFRADTAIGQYLGQTAPKVVELVKQAFGGVLLIDEASSFADGRSAASGDPLSKSCIDTLNRELSENGHKFVCIVTGYPDDILRDFFSINKGLQRRFTSNWEIEPYTPKEMLEIATRYIQSKHFILDGTLVADLFEPVLFPNNAGSVIAFVNVVIRLHAMHVFGKLEKFKLIDEDITTGFKTYKKTITTTEKTPTSSMYN